MKNMSIVISILILLVSACNKEPAGPAPQPYSGPEWTGTLPSDEVQVQGNLIDVRTICNPSEPEVFPQNSNYEFDASVVSACGGVAKYAVSLVENPGPEWVRAGSAAAVFVASDCKDLESEEWKAYGKSFRVGEITYYLHQYVGKSKKAGVRIPRPEMSTHSAMVIAPKITVNNVKTYGDAKITEASSPRPSAKINNVSFVVLPGGNYLAMCTGSGGNTGPDIFISGDKGVTWRKQGVYNSQKNLVVNMFTLFVHKGSLYLMGLGSNHMNLYILRSDDSGLTWTSPVIIFEGDCSTISTPVVESGGRIWKACERYADLDEYKRPFVISAPSDADLLDASSWVATNAVDKLSYPVDDYIMAGLIEGNIVVGRDGTIYDVLRTKSYWTTEYATRFEVSGIDKLDYAAKDFSIKMPGGGVKFVIRYDEVSDKYWALSNPDTGFPKIVRHDGITDLNHGNIRNRLVLLSSDDMVNWTVVNDKVLYDPDPFFHGFQYPDWMFDGNDIVGVVRAACPVAEGLPIRQHDGNMMLFFRIKDFRK
ncbi:MAG: glycoside hydrolase [Bacteroidales bacterium]|nr:glycoside hydrolase [Bacteroidales bacterium]